MISSISTAAPHHADHVVRANTATNASRAPQEPDTAPSKSYASDATNSASVSGGAASRSSAAVLAALNNLTVA